MHSSGKAGSLVDYSGGLRKLGNESKFVLARSCRAHSSEDAKRLLMVPWPTSQGALDQAWLSFSKCMPGRLPRD